MKPYFILFVCMFLTGCYFGANESGEEIMKGFYLAKWDENTWIAYSKNGGQIFDDEKIVISHNVFEVGNNDNFIIAKHHPCKNESLHYMDYDNLKPDEKMVNYLIIDTRNDDYKLYRFNSEKEFNDKKIEFGITKLKNTKLK